MLVQLLDGLGNPVTVHATRVLVTTDLGTPMALVIEMVPGAIETSRAEDPDFNVKLRTHGIDRTVQIGTLRAPQIHDFQFKV